MTGIQTTCTLGLKTIMQTYMNASSDVQPTVSVLGPILYVYSNGALNAGIAYSLYAKLPERGKYKLYVSQMTSGDTIKIVSSHGETLKTVTFPGGNFLFPNDSSIDPNFVVQHTLATTVLSGFALVARFGLNIIPSLTDYVENGIIDCLLTLGPSESFVITTTGLQIHLYRIFTAGTELPIYRFNSVGGGSFQVTSSNEFVIPSDESATLFGENQNIGDIVNVINSTSTPTNVTLTMIIAGVGTELPLNTVGYPL